MSGPELAAKFKKEVLGGYVRLLESIDPEVATHILSAQREAFLAGKTFFEEEVGHAERAINKIKRKAEAAKAEAAAAAEPPVTESKPSSDS